LNSALCNHLDELTGELVFTGSKGGMLRRSTFGRDVWRPACDGRAKTQRRPAIAAGCPGLTPHGMRHGNDTWLAEADVAEVARCARLGWEMPDKIQSICTHVSASMERHIIEVLERLWHDALTARAQVSTRLTGSAAGPAAGAVPWGDDAGRAVGSRSPRYLPRHEADPPRKSRNGPVTCVGTAGFEPTTP
jgi:hypothetical protein